MNIERLNIGIVIIDNRKFGDNFFAIAPVRCGKDARGLNINGIASTRDAALADLLGKIQI